jgi:hypothetical protein
MGETPMPRGSLSVIPAGCGVFGPPGDQSFLPSKNNPPARRCVPYRNSVTTPQWDGPGCPATILAGTFKLIANPTRLVNGFFTPGGPAPVELSEKTPQNGAE